MRAVAAVVPGTPALLPGATGRPVPEIEELRRACAEAVAALPDPVTVVGSGSRSRRHAVDGPDALGGFGVPGAGRPGPGEPLPLPLALGRALLHSLGRSAGALVEVGPEDAGTASAGLGGERSLLVVAEGSLTRSERGPGGDDPRGAAFDAALAGCLVAGDAEALAAVPVDLAATVGCTSVPALRVLAAWGAARDVRARLLHDAAPLGVGYLVATWTAP